MNIYEIEQYMKSKEKITIPEIQVKFHIGYGEIRRYFYDLQETREIILKEGKFYYNFAAEEILELYRTMLWECVRKQDYNKFKLKKEYRLDVETISGFEKWLKVHKYYDFINDKILLTRDDFINLFGKKEEPENEEKDEEKFSFADLVKEIANMDTEDLEGDEEPIDPDEDDRYEEGLMNLEEDDNEESEDDLIDIRATLKDDDTPFETCDAMLRQLLEGHSITTKEDFLVLAEQRLNVEEKEMPIFLDILESVIEDVKKMNEVEFKSYLQKLLKT